jgi:hypothetical protein
MKRHDEFFQPEMVDEHIEWFVSREKQDQSLAQTPDTLHVSSGPDERLLRDLHNLAQHDIQRLARIKERLVAQITTAPTPPFSRAPQHTQATDHTPRESLAGQARRRSLPFQESAPVSDLDTKEMAALEPATSLSLPGQTHRTQAGRLSRWIQALAAVLLLGILVGSLVTVLALRQHGQMATSTPLPTCQAYPLKQFAIPQPEPSIEAGLNAVIALSATDAWAVGFSVSPAQSTLTTLIEHWDGTRWQIVASPNGPTGTGNLIAISAASADDVWAVGSYDQPVNPPQEKPTSVRRALVEHWDGRQWNVAPDARNMPPDVGSSPLFAVTAVSADDVWAAGQVISSDHQTAEVLMEHWDGHAWTVIPGVGSTVADAGATGQINGMQAISANNIWAVGNAQQGGFILHWDGTHWAAIAPPFQSTNLDRVSATSSTDVWVLGNIEPSGHMVLAHWNGQIWSQVPAPPFLTSPQNILIGLVNNIAVVSPTDVWAIGEVSTGTIHQEILILHWNGTIWQRIDAPTLAASGQQSSFAWGIAVSANHQIWIIGNQETTALIEGQRTCP